MRHIEDGLHLNTELELPQINTGCSVRIARYLMKNNGGMRAATSVVEELTHATCILHDGMAIAALVFQDVHKAALVAPGEVKRE